jgi:hypothetical protein
MARPAAPNMLRLEDDLAFYRMTRSSPEGALAVCALCVNLAAQEPT